MASSRISESVVDARVTLQRLVDAKIFHGWVVSFDGYWLSVRLSGGALPATGDRFVCRIFRNGGDVAFASIAHSAEGNISQLGVQGQVSLLESQGDPRYARNLPATVDGMSATVCDVSPNGVGLISAFPYRSGDRIHVEVEGTSVSGEVRYCRPQSKESHSYRIGVRLDSMGRIDRARWMEIVQAAQVNVVSSRFAA